MEKSCEIEKMKVVVYDSFYEAGHVEEIDNNLDGIASIIDGWFTIVRIKRNQTKHRNICVVCDEEGEPKCLPIVRILPKSDCLRINYPIVGKFFVCAEEYGDFTSLTSEEIGWVHDYMHDEERMCPDED